MTARRRGGRAREPVAANAAGGELRVLVVEDSPIVRTRLVRMLREAGIRRVEEAASVDEAVDAASRAAPDAVLLDLEMPGGGGLAAMPAILAANPDAFVVVLTNHAEAEYRRRAAAAGAHRFFDKSVEFELAVEAVREQAHRGGPPPGRRRDGATRRVSTRSPAK